MQSTYFYHGLTSKYINAFGSIFNNITLKKYNNDTGAELERYKVPIKYGPREKWLARTVEDPNLTRPINVSLPMMSFVLTSMDYRPDKQLHPLVRIPKANNVNSNADAVYRGIPYNLTFDLSIIAKRKDDAYQILEQIIPSFNPSFTFSQILIPTIGIVRDIPVDLVSINDNIEYEDDFDRLLTVELILTFQMKVEYYGPVAEAKIIKTVFANTFIDPALSTGGSIIRVNVNNGNNGTYQIEDIVYQGNTIAESYAAGVVTKWDSNNSYLIIGATQGRFSTNVDIKAASSNATYNLASFDVSPLKVQSIKITPDPANANVTDPWNFAEEVLEFPNTA